MSEFVCRTARGQLGHEKFWLRPEKNIKEKTLCLMYALGKIFFLVSIKEKFIRILKKSQLKQFYNEFKEKDFELEKRRPRRKIAAEMLHFPNPTRNFFLLDSSRGGNFNVAFVSVFFNS